MKKIKFDCYNDGMLYVGENKELYDSNSNAIGKELIMKNRFFFSNSSIREEDRDKLNEDSKTSIKVKIKKNNVIQTTDLVKLNNKIYAINSIDFNRNNLFLYLTDYYDELDRIIEINEFKNTSALEDPQLILFKKVFSNIKNINSVTNSERVVADSVKTSERLKFKIRYLKELTEMNASNRFSVIFENKKYNIKQIIDIDMLHEILEIEGELDGTKS